MDNYRFTDDNHELDDVSRLILELKDLSGEGQNPVDDEASVFQQKNTVSRAEQVPITPNRRKKSKKSDVRHKRTVQKRSGLLPIWKVALIDILVGGIFILAFAMFHHVIPAITSAKEREEAMLHATEPAIVATQPPAPTEAPVEMVTEAPTEPDTRTEWQKKFEEHFSDEIILTENSYKSPNVSITLETFTYGEGNSKQTYHVADIYIASIDNFSTYYAGSGGSYASMFVEDMSVASNALIAMCGDYLTLQRSGFLMRNGTIFYETSNDDSICALFPDGTIETYEGNEYTIEDIKNRGAIQVWSFGPTLLDENGQVRTKYKMDKVLSYHNPRSAIGYYEPGHYCFVVADGRQKGYAKGLTIPELAQIFVDLGCTKAYNLDGGGSAVMAFNHKAYSKQSNDGRDLGDILLIRETPEFLAAHPEEVIPATVIGTEESNTVATEAGGSVG